jgi:hypothetical protein
MSSLRPHIVHSNLGSFARKQQTSLAPKPRSGTSDQHYFVFKFHREISGLTLYVWAAYRSYPACSATIVSPTSVPAYAHQLLDRPEPLDGERREGSHSGASAASELLSTCIASDDPYLKP